jgi:hypothetical protein
MINYALLSDSDMSDKIFEQMAKLSNFDSGYHGNTILYFFLRMTLLQRLLYLLVTRFDTELLDKVFNESAGAVLQRNAYMGNFMEMKPLLRYPHL